MSTDQSVNPNGIDNIQPKKQQFPQFENLKATLRADTNGQANLQITSLGLKNPIRLKADWDPESNLEQLLMQQIEAIDGLREDEGE